MSKVETSTRATPEQKQGEHVNDFSQIRIGKSFQSSKASLEICLMASWPDWTASFALLCVCGKRTRRHKAFSWHLAQIRSSLKRTSKPQHVSNTTRLWNRRSNLLESTIEFFSTMPISPRTNRSLNMPIKEWKAFYLSSKKFKGTTQQVELSQDLCTMWLS